ncbi:AMP-binding protein [Nocardia sp. NPDC050175]|uniref:AMP-binding protein n=1 Tax=Nocardia sp. NPDC050175 TaxID=3364317 RepID=UPI00378C4719
MLIEEEEMIKNQVSFGNIVEAKNVGQLLLNAAQQHSESKLLYCSAGGGAEFRESNYQELLTQAFRVLSGLRERDLRPSDKVLLSIEEADAFLPVFWACLLGGFVPCPLPPVAGTLEQSTVQYEKISQLLDQPLLVTSERLAAELSTVPRLIVTTVEELLNHSPARDLHDAVPEDLAVLMLTSGSTGHAKAVMLTHANLLTSMSAKNGYHELTSSDIALNWVGFDHVAALLECHLLPVSTGSSQVHVPPSVILDEPLEFLRMLSRYRATMTFTPNFLLGLINSMHDRIQPDDLFDLSRLRHIVSGGEAVPRTTGVTFLERFAGFGLRRDVLWPAFGMTETCAGSIYSREFPDADAGHEFAGVGTPVAALDVRVADQQDRALPDGHAGELQLRGAMVTPGYYRNVAATRAAFTPDGWFRTGDIGRLGNGRLTLIGRSKDNIVVNGVNYFSHDIETMLQQIPGVAPSYVAAFPTRPVGSETEQLVVAFHSQTRPGDDAALYRIITAVRNAVVMHWGFLPGLVLPLGREDFVKNSIGKISRAKLRTRLEAGEFDTIIHRGAELIRRRGGEYSPPRSETEQTLVDIYADIFSLSSNTISATVNFFDLGGTSLDLLRLRRSVTQRLSVPHLQTVDLLNAPTARTLGACIEDKTRRMTNDDYDPVVPMQQTGTQTPLFCVHGGAGEVLNLLDLAKYFAGVRPFYALRARGFTDGETPFVNYREMITSYTRAIRRRQPRGPYLLSGYSSGGVIAFAIARELESGGETVAFLGVFDCPPMIKPMVVGVDFSVMIAIHSLFLGLIDQKQSIELPDRLRGVPFSEQLKAVLDLAHSERIAELDLNLTRYSTWMMLIEKLNKIRAEYEPQGEIQSITVFHGTAAPPLPIFKEVPLSEAGDAWVARQHDWDKFAVQPVRYINIDGEHHTLAAPPHVGTFHARLRDEIDRSLGERD